MEVKNKPTKRLPGLDFLRVFSVSCVIFSHAGYELFRGLGVPLLLALSGFLITKSLLNAQYVKIKEFWAKRFLRIAPAYLSFVLIAYLIDWYLGDAWDVKLMFHALTHTVNYYNALNGHPTFTGSHLWTLSLLEQFYVLFPVLFLFCFFKNNFVYIISLIIFFSIVWRFFIYFGFVDFEHVNAWIYNALDTRLDCILIGSLGAYFFTYRHQFIVSTFNSKNSTFVLIISLLAIYNLRNYSDIHYTLGFSVEAILAMLIIFCMSNVSTGRLSLAFSNRFISFLAKISYPMYLYHSIAFGFSNKFLSNDLLIFVVGYTLAVILGITSYMTIEKFFLTLRDRNKNRLVFR